VVKVAFEEGDGHPIGSLALVLGSVSHPTGFGYFLEWKADPRVAVFCVGWKIRRG
jgi:hypothetical protein